MSKRTNGSMSDRRIVLRSVADLMAMSPEQADAEAYKSLLNRQWEAFAAIKSGSCSLACLAATDAFSDCECVCRAAYHGHLWSSEIVTRSDWGETYKVFWSSRDQIERDTEWGHAQQCDRSASFETLDQAKRFMQRLAKQLGPAAEVIAVPILED